MAISKQGLRQLGNGALIITCGLMSYMIVEYYVIIRVKLIMVTCVFELTVILNLHFLSQCRF